MPLSSAPVSVIMPRKPPRIITKRQTGNASAKPLTGAVKKSLNVAAVTASVVPETITVMTATIANRARRMVNDEGMPRFFLAVSVIVLIPPSLYYLGLSRMDGAQSVPRDAPNGGKTTKWTAPMDTHTSV